MEINLYFRKKVRFASFFLFILVLWAGCQSDEPETVLRGYTMGTTYSIRIPGTITVSESFLKTAVDSILSEINHQMSAWDSTSDLTRINRTQDLSWHPIPVEFAEVLNLSNHLSDLTEGAFDITVGPLIELWGFHRPIKPEYWNPPSPQAIDSTLRHVGYRLLQVKGNRIQKFDPNVVIDVNAIAKGYGVDAIAEWLDHIPVENYMVEIGGEVRCRGKNKRNSSWAIGIDNPTFGSRPGERFHTIVALPDGALATSGDYRNFISYQGKTYSHTIDPHTGYPSQWKVGSASVFAPACALADGLATALLVLSPEKGLALINQLDGVEALLIVRTETGFIDKRSDGFAELENP
ncbi:MAG: FAD:protein FMN transferase [Fidelibacterota bacterium]